MNFLSFLSRKERPVERQVFLFGWMEIEIKGVDYNGMLLVYSQEMSYSEFCECNPSLETRVDWDETTSDAMDAYYYCKSKAE